MLKFGICSLSWDRLVFNLNSLGYLVIISSLNAFVIG